MAPWWAPLALVVLAAGCAEEAPPTTPLEALYATAPDARLSRSGGRLTRVYSRALATGDSPIDTAAQFVRDHAPLFGAQPGSLVPARTPGQDLSLSPAGAAPRVVPVMYDPTTERYRFSLVTYAQTLGGIPVYGGEVRLLVANRPSHPLVLVSSALRNTDRFPGPAGPNTGRANRILRRVDDKRIRRAAEALVARSLTQWTTPRPVFWAGARTDEAPVEAVVFEGGDGGAGLARNRWRFVADAQTGRILHRVSLVHTAVSGTVTARAGMGVGAPHCDTEEPVPMPYARVEIAGGPSVYTNGDGTFSLPDGGEEVTVDSLIQGMYFSMSTVAGPESTVTRTIPADGSTLFEHNAANDDELILAQVNTYINANRVRDWLLDIHPDWPIIATQTDMPIVVNLIGGRCPGNAWYTTTSPGTINFCRSGTNGTVSYDNTGYASLVYHEYGHHIVQTGGSGQQEYGEGMSDVINNLVLDDPRLAVGFRGDQCDDISTLRTADNDCQYDESFCSSCGGGTHSCGNLLSGSVWSVRQALAATDPANALAITSQLAVNSVLLHTGRDIDPQIAIDFLTLDDDDGDLENGTPHRFEICAGFGAHGLDCPAIANHITISLPERMTESDGTVANAATLTLRERKGFPIEVTLSSSDPGQLGVPATVTFPPWTGTLSFALTPVDDTLLDGSQTVVVTAVATDIEPATAALLVDDNETATLGVTVPTNAAEGDGTLVATGTVTVGQPVDADVVVSLSSNDQSEITVPAAVTIPNGTTSATFDIQVMDDNVIDGPETAVVTAHVEAWTDGTAQISIADNEPRILSLTVPSQLREGAGTVAAVARIAVPTPVEDDLAVQIESNHGIIVVPDAVTIAAGTAHTDFDLEVTDDAVLDNARTVTLTATAASYVSSSADIIVVDDDPHHFFVEPIASPGVVHADIPVTITARNASGGLVEGFHGTVALAAADATGAVPITPATTTSFVAGQWSGLVRFGALASGATLTATGTGGAQGTSPPFDIGPDATVGFRMSPLGPTLYPRQPAQLTITAVDQYGFTTPAFTDTVSLHATAGSGPTPVPIAMLPPSTPTFVDGAWTGTVLLEDAGEHVVVVATDAQGRQGQTNPFTVAYEGTLTLDIPSPVAEGDGQITGTLRVAPAPSSDLVVALSTSHPTKAAPPTTAVVPAGIGSTDITIAIGDNAIIDGPTTAVLGATVTAYAPAAASVVVVDNESSVVSISLPPEVIEGQPASMGSVQLAPPPETAVTVTLVSEDAAQVTVPASVVVPAGSGSASFPVTAIDDSAIDGPRDVRVTASVAGWGEASAITRAVDNEGVRLTAAMSSQLVEGGGVVAGALDVSIEGTLPSDLLVTLSVSPAGLVSIPATATIPAGDTRTSVDVVVLHDDGAYDDTTSVTLSATAPDFSAGAVAAPLIENDPHHFVIHPVPSPQVAAVPFSVRVDAVDAADQLLPAATTSFELTASGSSGAHPIDGGAGLSLVAGTWTGPVAILGTDTDVVLRAQDGGGGDGTSAPFDVTAGPHVGFEVAGLTTEVYSHARHTVTVTAVDANGYRVRGFDGAAALSTRLGSDTAIVISELSVNEPSFVEIHNVSSEPVDTTGWRLVLGDSATDIDEVNPATWALPTIMEADAILYRSETAADNPLGGAIAWTADTPGWAMVIDASDRIVDFVAWRWKAPQLATMAPVVDGTTIALADDFRGSGVGSAGVGSLQRYGSEDHNDARDFINGAVTKGTKNVGIATPFTPGVLSMEPATPVALTAGSWTGDLTLVGVSPEVRIDVDDGAGHTGRSTAFALTIAPTCDPDPCDNGGTCTPTEASFDCVCPAGYGGNRCDQDIDECTTGAATCSPNATCTNTTGSYQCACKPGFSGDGITCAVVCGDGAVGPSEQCDDGEANSDVNADACRSDCTRARCGDGVVDSGESCDDGADNDDQQPGACRTTCALASCGDGVVDGGEACDDGTGNSDTEPNACRTTCAAAFCGDGVVDDGDQCDDGAANSDTAPDRCRRTCVPPRCGDGVVDSGEACDEGDRNADDGNCTAACRRPEPPENKGCAASEPSHHALWLLALALFLVIRRRRS